MESFVRGLSYPLRAVGFVRQHRLTRFVVAPLCLGALLYAGFAVSLFFWFGDASSAIWARPSVTGMWGALLGFFWQLFRGVLLALVLGLAALVFVLITQILAAPFHELLSEKTEEIVLGSAPGPFTLSRALSEVRYALSDLVRALLLWVCLNLGLLLLHLVPGVGSAACAALNALFAMLWLTYEFLDYPLARRRMAFGRKWRLILGNPGLSLGFGLAVFALLLVPLVGLFLLPFACVGGTLLFCDLTARGALSGSD